MSIGNTDSPLPSSLGGDMGDLHDVCSLEGSMYDELDTAGLSLDSDDVYGDEEGQMDYMVREINEDIWSLDSCSIHSFNSGSSHYTGSSCSDSDCCDDAVDLTPLVLSNRKEFTHDTLILTQHNAKQLQEFHAALSRHVAEVKAKYSDRCADEKVYEHSVIEIGDEIETSIHGGVSNGDHPGVYNRDHGGLNEQLQQSIDRKALLNSCYQLYIALQHVAGIEDPEDYILQWNVEDSSRDPESRASRTVTSPLQKWTSGQQQRNNKCKTPVDKRKDHLRDMKKQLKELHNKIKVVENEIETLEKSINEEEAEIKKDRAGTLKSYDSGMIGSDNDSDDGSVDINLQALNPKIDQTEVFRIDKTIDDLSSEVRHCMRDMGHIRRVLAQVYHHTPTGGEEEIGEIDCERYQQSADTRLIQIEQTLAQTSDMCRQNAESIHDIKSVLGVETLPSGVTSRQEVQCDRNIHCQDLIATNSEVDSSCTGEYSIDNPEVELTECKHIGVDKAGYLHSSGSKIRVITNSNRKSLRPFDESYAEVTAKFLPPYRQNSSRYQGNQHHQSDYYEEDYQVKKHHRPRQDSGQVYGGQTRYYGRSGQRYHGNKPMKTHSSSGRSHDKPTQSNDSSSNDINKTSTDRKYRNSNVDSTNNREQRAHLPQQWRKQPRSGSNSPANWRGKRGDSPVHWQSRRDNSPSHWRNTHRDTSSPSRPPVKHVVTYKNNPINNVKQGKSDNTNSDSSVKSPHGGTASKPLLPPLIRNQPAEQGDQLKLYRKQIQQKPSALVIKPVKPVKAVH